MAITLKKLYTRFNQLAANDTIATHLFIPFVGGQGSASRILSFFADRDNLSRALDAFTPTQISTAKTAVYGSLDPIDKAIVDLILAGKNYISDFSSQEGYEKAVIYILLNAATT